MLNVATSLAASLLNSEPVDPAMINQFAAYVPVLDKLLEND